MLVPFRLATMAATATLAAAVGVALPGAAAPSKPKPVVVTIKSFAFSPATVRVKAGQAITVKNADSTTHTLTEGASNAHDGMKMSKHGFDTGNIASGKSAALTLRKKGTYDFHCHLHPTMKGKIVVRA